MGLRKSLLQLAGLIGISFVLSACSTAPENTPDLPEKEYYQEAQKAMDENKPATAVKHLKDLDSRYPFGEYSLQTKLELIYANYLAGDYVEAHAAAERFIKSYPNNDFLDYAFYYRALSTYKGAENLSYRYLKQDLSARDITDFMTSFNEFSELLKRYPGSPYNVDAKARMVFLRNIIARHEVDIARYYFKRNAPIAALKRGQTVLADYPSSTSIEEALAVIIQAYITMDEKELADKNLAILKLNYPKSSHIDENGNFIVPPLPKDADPDFWYWITLGWID